MVFQSEKQLKLCPYCGKSIANLATHIINQHPKILEQLEEKGSETPPDQSHSVPNAGLNTQNKPIAGDTKALIREKLDTFFDAALLKYMSSNDNVGIKDLAAIANPPQQTSLHDYIEFHKLMNSQKSEPVESGAGWMDLLNNALPIIGQMLPNKRSEVKNELRTNEGASIPVSGTIQQEAGEHRNKPIDLSEESSDPGSKSE